MTDVKHRRKLDDGVGSDGAQVVLELDDIWGAICEGNGLSAVEIAACRVYDGESVRLVVVCGIGIVYMGVWQSEEWHIVVGYVAK